MKKGQKSNRTRLSPEARYEQLLSVSRQILLNEPLEELTMERVAAEAGVSRALVFHYFPTIRGLHLACLELSADELAELVVAATDGEGHAERSLAGISAFFDYIERQPRTFEAMSHFATVDPDFGKVFEAFRSQMVELIVERDGLTRDPLSMVLFHSWVSMVEAAAHRLLQDPLLDRSALVEALVDVYLHLVGRWQQQIDLTDDEEISIQL